MKSPALHILLVEDDRDDYEVIATTLAACGLGDYQLHWVCDYTDALTALDAAHYQVALFDDRLGRDTGVSLLKAVKQRGLSLPVILLTNANDRAADIAAMQAGAADYLVKTGLTPITLERALRYALERQRLLEQVARREAQLQIIMQESPTGLVVLGPDKQILFANPAAEKLFGKQHDRLFATLLDHLKNLDHRQEIELGKASDEASTLDVRFTPIEWHNANATLATLTDITPRKRTERALQQQAFYDALTGLSTRIHFMDNLHRAMAAAHRTGRKLALLFLDLDHFKQINDQFGHAAGDELLKQFGARLRQCTREDDILARLGGDEFVLLLNNLENQQHAGRVAEKIAATLADSFVLADTSVRVGTSIGIAVYPDSNISADTRAETLLKHADTAMYQAKRLGRSNYQYFAAEMQQAAVMRTILEYDLGRALADQEFRLYFRPQVNAERQWLAIETLLYWQHPRRGLLSANDFLPAAENSSQLIMLGKWFLNKALQQYREWLTQGALNRDIRLALKLWPRQLHPETIECLQTDLVNLQLSAKQLDLQFSEFGLSIDHGRYLNLLPRFAELGVQLVLNDYGSGQLALSQLLDLPFHGLKLTETLATAVTNHHAEHALLRAALEIAGYLEKRVGAAGIKESQQLIWLQRHHCDYFTGEHCGRTLPLADFETQFKHNSLHLRPAR